VGPRKKPCDMVDLKGRTSPSPFWDRLQNQLIEVLSDLINDPQLLDECYCVNRLRYPDSQYDD